MDGSDLNSSHNDIYFGKEDDDEDDDAYKPFGIQNRKNECKAKPKVAELTGFNSTPSIDNLNLNKAKKNKKKPKESVPKSFQNNDPIVQESGLYFNHNENEMIDTVKPPVEEIRSNVNDRLFNVTTPQNRIVTEPIILQNQPLVSMQSHPQAYFNYQPRYNQQMIVPQNLYNSIGGQRFVPSNPVMYNLNMANNQVRHTAPPPLDRTPVSNYSLTSTYNHRLVLVDTLFRFIMQILRTPEPPPVQQIENLKHMLDLMIVSKPPDN